MAPCECMIFGCRRCRITRSSLQSSGSICRLALLIRLSGHFTATSMPQKTPFVTTPNPPNPRRLSGKILTSFSSMRQCSVSPSSATRASEAPTSTLCGCNGSACSASKTKPLAVLVTCDSGSDLGLYSEPTSIRSDGSLSSLTFASMNSALHLMLFSSMSLAKPMRSRSSIARLLRDDEAIKHVRRTELITVCPLGSSLPMTITNVAHIKIAMICRMNMMCHRTGISAWSAVTQALIASKAAESEA
mmetsp:Transcript_69990/g.204813  ORF Transcript_69990/g.204813 Transcript_69990/m.204813 type:complete len:246 (-) Transcript_69990:521-1258(-)